MSRTRTLANLRADVRWISDTEGLTLRHTDANVNRAINQAVQAFRLMLADHGSSFYLREASFATVAGTDTVDLSLVASGNVVQVYGIDVSVDGEWRELFEFSFAERNRYQDSWSGDNRGTPTYYQILNIGTVNAPTGASAGDLRLMPTPDAVYTMRVFYLPVLADMSADGDFFNGLAGWEDWVVYEAALRLCERDAGGGDNLEGIRAGLARVETRIKRAASRLNRPHVLRRVDTLGRRRDIEAFNRWKLWG